MAQRACPPPFPAPSGFGEPGNPSRRGTRPGAAAGDRQFRSVQILRCVAACAVVLAHLVAVERKYLPGAPITPGGLEFGTSGVDLFFVISGFIITTATAGGFRRAGDTRRFLLRRFARIYPLYWIYFAAVLPLFLLDPGMVNSSHGRPNLLTSFLLLPDRNMPLLLVAWTLSFELYFYVVCAVAFRLAGVRRAPLALGLWGLAVAACSLILRPAATEQPILHLMLDPLNLEFIAGCWVARLATGLDQRRATLCLLAGVAVLGAGAAAFGLAPLMAVSDWPRVAIYGSGFALVLAGAVGWEAVARRAPRVILAIGDASYSLYLSHILTLGAVGLIWGRIFAAPGLPNHVALLAVALTAALVWAWISYVVAERPLHNAARRLLRTPARSGAQGLSMPASALPAGKGG